MKINPLKALFVTMWHIKDEKNKWIFYELQEYRQDEKRIPGPQKRQTKRRFININITGIHD